MEACTESYEILHRENLINRMEFYAEPCYELQRNLTQNSKITLNKQSCTESYEMLWKVTKNLNLEESCTESQKKKFLWIVMQNLINLTNLAQNVIKSYTESYKNLTNLKQNRVKSYLRIL